MHRTRTNTRAPLRDAVCRIDLFHDHFTNSTPESEWRSCLEHAEKIGVGSREYELMRR